MNSALDFIPQDLRDTALDLLEHPLAPQIGPFIALLFVSLSVLGFIRVVRLSQNYWLSVLRMILENIGLSFPWLWSSPSPHSHSKSKKVVKKPRTRAEQSVLNGHATSEFNEAFDLSFMR